MIEITEEETETTKIVDRLIETTTVAAEGEITKEEAKGLIRELVELRMDLLIVQDKVRLRFVWKTLSSFSVLSRYLLPQDPLGRIGMARELNDPRDSLDNTNGMMMRGGNVLRDPSLLLETVQREKSLLRLVPQQAVSCPPVTKAMLAKTAEAMGDARKLPSTLIEVSMTQWTGEKKKVQSRLIAISLNTCTVGIRRPGYSWFEVSLWRLLSLGWNGMVRSIFTLQSSSPVLNFFFLGSDGGGAIGMKDKKRRVKPGKRNDDGDESEGGRNVRKESLRIGTGKKGRQASLTTRRGSLKKKDRTSEKEAKAEAALERRTVYLPE